MGADVLIVDDERAIRHGLGAYPEEGGGYVRRYLPQRHSTSLAKVCASAPRASGRRYRASSRALAQLPASRHPSRRVPD